MKRSLAVIGLAVVLAGCGSSVKLDPVPVVDKTGTTTGSGAAGSGQTDASAVGKGTVASVALAPAGSDAALQTSARVVYFDYDSFAIRPEFQTVIDSHARYIRADKSRKVVIEGHTDERGGREYNLALGQKRADTVRRSLALLGVPEAQLESVSFGKEKPAAMGSSEAALEKNRRAEISYR